MADRPNVEEVFEAWAHVAARVRKRTRDEHEAILSGLGIGSEWDAVHEMWSKRLNEDIVAKRMDRPQRYAQICRDEQLRRARSAGAASIPGEAQGGVPAATTAVPEEHAAQAVQPPTRGSAPPPPARGNALPPPLPVKAPQPTVQLGVAKGPRLGLGGKPSQLRPPMRRRAETLDIKDPPAGDAIPFGPAAAGPRAPAATVDFRDLVTPQRVKPATPWAMQEITTGAITGAATDVAADRRGQGSATGDFRRDLGAGKPSLPRPNQDDTASGIDLAATVEAARQVSDVVGWTVERWARLCVALERQPQNAAAVWNEHGITSPEAREHAARQWQRKLDKEPSVKAEMMGHLARFRALP